MRLYEAKVKLKWSRCPAVGICVWMKEMAGCLVVGGGSQVIGDTTSASQTPAASEPPGRLVWIKMIGPHPLMSWEMFNQLIGKIPWCVAVVDFPGVNCTHLAWFQATNMVSLNVESRRAALQHAIIYSISTIHQRWIQVTWAPIAVKCSYLIRKHCILNIYYFHFKYNLFTWKCMQFDVCV